MSNTVRNILLALVVVALGVNAYILWGGDSNSGPKTKKIVENTNSPETPAKKAVNEAAKKATPLDVKNGDDKSLDPLAAQKANQSANLPKTTVEFAEYEHDFGTIDQNSENAFVFEFVNTGSEPLIIEKAKGSCGCTVPEYPKEPIAPGATGEINVVYKPGKQKNQQTKTVTVTANTEPVQTILKIKAEVNEVPS